MSVIIGFRKKDEGKNRFAHIVAGLDGTIKRAGRAASDFGVRLRAAAKTIGKQSGEIW
ncbi:hypothetical protein [Burkholderia sp. 22PA0106]|uniref:hypothetical protein n=1 Tax=Burkholderia sp. 22PA0106 TaxID=3237371 RepID=UPI0039C18BD0